MVYEEDGSWTLCKGECSENSAWCVVHTPEMQERPRETQSWNQNEQWHVPFCVPNRTKYFVEQVPLGVVGFFDSLWNEKQIACAVSTMKYQLNELELCTGVCSGIIRFLNFHHEHVVAKVNTSPGHFGKKQNTLINTI